MSVRLRLQRHGAKKRPYYRIVAADQRSPRDGRYRELLGTYNPMNEPNVVDIDIDRVEYWLGVGAQPTERVTAVINAYKAGKYISTAEWTESNKERLTRAREAALAAKAVEPPKPKEDPKAEAAAEEPKAEEPKAEEPKAEEPKAEAAAEEPKAEAAAEEPKAEEPKVEAAAEEPKAEEPNAEAGPEEPKADA